MLELMLCSLFTLLPDYLYRRYGQGKRFGREITFYSFWYEFRYGLTTCLMLTIALITTIFYFHPSTTSVTAYFRTVPILPETNGRVAEVFVGFTGDVEKGAPIFRLDSTKQEAALEVANKQIAEVDASFVMAKADIAAAEGQIQQAKGAYEQAVEELQTKEELYKRNPDVVATREIERLRNVVEGRQGGVVAADAAKQAAETKLSTLLPAQKASAEAAREQAQVDLSKTVVYAGVTGRVEQFILRVGDVVNPLMRPAGILVPAGAGPRKSDCWLQSDRSAGDESRHDGGSHLHLQAVDDHSHGGHAGAGLRRCRPGPHFGTAYRCPTGHATRHAHRLPSAHVRGRARGRYSRQQLHRQRLHQQSRGAGEARHRHWESGCSCTSSTRSASCTR